MVVISDILEWMTGQNVGESAGRSLHVLLLLMLTNRLHFYSSRFLSFSTIIRSVSDGEVNHVPPNRMQKI